MKARDDIYTWPMALVLGSVITLALFFTLPKLRFKQPNLEPPVIEIDFMQWREPAPAPITKKPAPKPTPVVKPEPPPIAQRPEQKTKEIEQPVIQDPVISEQRTEPESAKQTPLTPEVSPPPAVTQPVKTADVNDEELPVPAPIFKLTSMPRFAHKVEPSYPHSMLELEREATVKLEVLIDHKGNVRKVTILQSGGEIFDQAARTALLASSFIPGNIEGKPVAVLMRIPITFRLK
ncbi:TonB family protein [Kaarinaea lacus]